MSRTPDETREAGRRFGAKALRRLQGFTLPAGEKPRWRAQMVIRGGEHVGYRLYKGGGLLGTYTFHSYQWF